MFCSSEPLVPVVDIHNQSVRVPDSGGARQSRLAPIGGVTGFTYDDVKTLLEVMSRGRKISADGRCLGWRDFESEYSWITYNDVIKRAENFASGLINVGMQPGQSSFVGIYAQNCVEWVLTEYACYHQSAVVVPLYDTLGPNTCTFVINQADIEIVICDKETKAKSLLEKTGDTPGLKHIVVMACLSEEIRNLANEKDITLHLFKDIEDLGRRKPASVVPPNPSDIATVCYTSGTTGSPKGAVLTHANLVTNVCSFALHLEKPGFSHSDVLISYLPLAHIMERVCQILMFMHGASVGFYRGDISLLMEDMQTLKPTVFPVVPRLLNKIYNKVQSKANKNRIKRYLFDMALQAKASELERLIIRNNSIWDWLVFSSLQQKLGGRIRIMCNGAAPVSKEVLNFFRCAMGCPVLTSFGQTECAAPITIGVTGDYSIGNSGAPVPCNHIKLVDVPDLGYFASKDQGEVCVKGNNVFKGYLKDPEKTAETIDEEGWLHTGDIGMWLPNGTLKIIDRKKNIFKLSQGEYVAPEKIELIYIASQYVAQVFVYGDSLQSCLVGIVVPDKEEVLDMCKTKQITGDWNEICRNEAVKQFIYGDLYSLGYSAGLKSFEQVKEIYLHPALLTHESGLLTPTMKLKRHDCQKYFQLVIEEMYQKLK